ncbi:hypothetical protein MMC11_003274 [Xylographa trunciseda]|nr:hypothetical protein [Xylographa trunciseda]
MASSINTDSYNEAAVLTDGHVLTTTATSADGTTSLTSSLDLNTVVGNVNGTFSWGGTNFSQGAQNVEITDGFQLEADLPDGNGNLAHSMMYIGSVVTTDANGKPALQHTVGTNYSSAHATANTNAQADSVAASQAQTTGSSSIGAVNTIQGDAATYWPDGNAPASGNSSSKAKAREIIEIVHFILEIFEMF